MTRKNNNNKNAGNATVAAVQQAHIANVQAAKNVAAPKPQAAAKPQSKPSTPAQLSSKVQSKPATPVSMAAAAKPSVQQAKVQAAPPKPATPQKAQASKVQAAPLKPQVAQSQSKPSTPQTKAQAAPIKPQQRAASAKKYDIGPGYEGFMMPNMFQEPSSWTKNQSPCHAPHRAAIKQLNKQPSFKAATPISKPSTPVPKAQANNKGAKAAPIASTKGKNAVKWSSPAGKQLILRPKMGLKSTIAPPKSAKSPEIFSFVKAPTSNASSVTHSRQASAQKAPLKKQQSASSPVGNTPDIFAMYMEPSAKSKPQTPSQQYAAIRAAKPKPAPYMSASMPREMMNAFSEGSNVAYIKLNNDAHQRGLQMGPKPKQQQNNKARVASAKPSTPTISNKNKRPAVEKSNSWFTPSGIAVASAIVAIGGVGISKLAW
ncbi:hypothetical protein BDR26DRAFT_292887 [Obelidium mucronatum]|nr:hypothetical protein BDR26DRAFT_292887 [Obelidium mucronatum]